MLYEPHPVGRICKICGHWTPCASLKKSRASLYGVAALCKECHNACSKSPKQPPDDPSSISRICRVCGKTTPYEELKKVKNGMDGVAHICLVCHCNTSKKRYAENSEELMADRRRYYEEHPDKKEEIRIYKAEWLREDRADDPEKYRIRKRLLYAKNPEPHKQRSREWHANNPAKVTLISHRRRTEKALLPHAFRDTDWIKALDYFDNRCATCGRQRGFWHTLAVDHWIPIHPNYELAVSNPGTVPWNIVPLCHGEGGCNNSKCNNSPEEWLADHFGPRKAKQILKRIQDYFEWVRQQE